jgi:hypothetical protein
MVLREYREMELSDGVNTRLYSLLIVAAFVTEFLLALSLPFVPEPAESVAAMGVITPIILALLQLRGKANGN